MRILVLNGGTGTAKAARWPVWRRTADARLFSAILAGFCFGCDRPPRNEEAVVMVGTVERERLEMAAPVFEAIAEILVEEGQEVEAGRVLLRFDDQRLREEIASLRSARDQEKAKLEELLAGTRVEEIAQARAQHEASQARAENAEIELVRAQALYHEDADARTNLDAAQTTRDTSVAEEKRTREALAQAERGPRPEDISAQRAALLTAESRLKEAEVRLEQLVIRAPVPAFIETLPFRPGERVLMGSTVAAILELDRPYARVFIPERARAWAVAGREGTARVDGIAREFKARVRTVSADATFTPFFALTERERTRLSYPAKVDLLGTEARALPAGMPVEVTLPREAGR